MSPRHFFWFLFSAMIHLAVFIPLLAGWMFSKPPIPDKPAKVQVHLSKTPPSQNQEPPKLAKTQGGGGSRQHHPDRAPVRRRPRPTRTQPMVAVNPVPSTRPRPQPVAERMPSVDSGSYPTAPQAHRGGPEGGPGDGEGAGNGSGRGPGSGQEDGSPNGTPRGRGHVEIGPKITRLPTNVPVPEPLRKVTLKHFEMKMEITVDITGKAKIRLMESCGSSQLDVFVMGELEHTPWKPATLDGRPVVNVFRLVMYGEMQPNSATFSITGLDTAE